MPAYRGSRSTNDGTGRQKADGQDANTRFQTLRLVFFEVVQREYVRSLPILEIEEDASWWPTRHGSRLLWESSIVLLPGSPHLLDNSEYQCLLTWTGGWLTVDDATEFLRGTAKEDECEGLFKQYKQCLSVSFYSSLFRVQVWNLRSLLAFNKECVCHFVDPSRLTMHYKPTSLLCYQCLPSSPNFS